ncbi:MAG: hypothetical protein ABIW32_01080 [Terrimesophilobacter sp.]
MPVTKLDYLRVIDSVGATVMFGLWGCHTHPGTLRYSPLAEGCFEPVAALAARATANLLAAVRMGVPSDVTWE